MTEVSATSTNLGSGNRPASETVIWACAVIILIASIAFRGQLPWLTDYPSTWVLPIADWINFVMDWIVAKSRWFFRSITWLLSWPMIWIQALLHFLPWPVTIAIFAGFAQFTGGWRLTAFTVVALFYMVATGFWDQSMNTLTLVFMAIPLAGGLGLFVGIGAYRSRRIETIVTPFLDAMQTVPMFAYLIPILVLFGFGPTVAIIATAIYAFPPMVRNVMFGLRHVPAEIAESGLMSGATKRQLMWMVLLPSAMPSVLLGLNQVVLQSLNMIIISAVIGSTRDIGWEVLSALRKAWFGQSLMAGAVVVLLAIILDRITRGFISRPLPLRRKSKSVFQRYRALWIALAIALLISGLSNIVPILKTYPEAWYYRPGDAINESLIQFTVNYAHVMDWIKRTLLFYFLLPLKLGLGATIKPYTWGFEFTPVLIFVYALTAAILSIICARKWSWQHGFFVAMTGTILYFGIVNLPWPAFVAIMTAIAYSVGGTRIGLFTVLGLAFMLVAGIWTPAINSIYLCLAAVLASFLLGGSLAIWAAHNDLVSNVLTPIVDTLQTMPLFVFLIPVLMFFQVGELPAFLAITAYAMVAATRYTEHGLRNVPQNSIEVAKAVGCTPGQVFWQVRLPLAMPAVMLGLNQTIMFALQMLAISALVGSIELGQEIYTGLSNANTGQGIVAAIGIVTIAMISDRTIQSWSARRKTVLGFS